MVYTCLFEVVAVAHVARDAHEAGAEGGGPGVAWKAGGVKGGRAGEEWRTWSDVQRWNRHGVDGRGGCTVLVEEFERTSAGVVQVTGVLDVGFEGHGVATNVGVRALVVGDRES